MAPWADGTLPGERAARGPVSGTLPKPHTNKKTHEQRRNNEGGLRRHSAAAAAATAKRVSTPAVEARTSRRTSKITAEVRFRKHNGRPQSEEHKINTRKHNESRRNHNLAPETKCKRANHERNCLWSPNMLCPHTTRRWLVTAFITKHSKTTINAEDGDKAEDSREGNRSWRWENKV